MYLCFELDWDVRLLLKQNEVPALKLGGGQRSGLDDVARAPATRRRDADDLCLDAEAFVDRREHAPHE